jgi:hypothetical protein
MPGSCSPSTPVNRHQALWKSPAYSLTEPWSAPHYTLHLFCFFSEHSESWRLTGLIFLSRAVAVRTAARSCELMHQDVSVASVCSCQARQPSVGLIMIPYHTPLVYMLSKIRQWSAPRARWAPDQALCRIGYLLHGCINSRSPHTRRANDVPLFFFTGFQTLQELQQTLVLLLRPHIPKRLILQLQMSPESPTIVWV